MLNEMVHDTNNEVKKFKTSVLDELVANKTIKNQRVINRIGVK